MPPKISTANLDGAVDEIPLVYLQADPNSVVTVPLSMNAKILHLDEFRKSDLSPPETLKAIVGNADPMSAILGRHPDHLTSSHPTHNLILETVIHRLTIGVEPTNKPSLSVPELNGSALVIGGPLASGHAAAIFGTKETGSILGVDLPVRFDLSEVIPGEPALEKRAAMIIEGRIAREEYFLITSLPLGPSRLINISARTSCGGDAVDLVLGNAKIMERLRRRTEKLGGAWQALFKVNVEWNNVGRKEQPKSIDPDFQVFPIRDINFDSLRYALNDPLFLRKYGDFENSSAKFEIDYKPAYIGPVKTKTARSNVVDLATEEETLLVDRFNSISNSLSGNPKLAPLVRKHASRLLAQAQPAVMAKAPPEARYENRTNRKELAPDFIRRVYGHLLDGNFTRADLRRTDASAEKGLRNWEQINHRLSLEELNLPTVEERNSQLLTVGVDAEPDALRQNALKKIEYDRRRKKLSKSMS